MASLVMVVSGANVWTMKNAKPHPSGFWAKEFVTLIASSRKLDPRSRSQVPARCDRSAG